MAAWYEHNPVRTVLPNGRIEIYYPLSGVREIYDPEFEPMASPNRVTYGKEAWTPIDTGPRNRKERRIAAAKLRKSNVR
jgi:hypothetical protein